MIKDDLIALLPEFFQKIKEYPEIMKVWGSALETGETNILKVYANLFVQTCDEPTIYYWEKHLEIVSPVGATLEDRRKAVMDSLSSSKTYTNKSLYLLIEEMFGQSWSTSILYPWVVPYVEFHGGTRPPTFELSLVGGNRYGIRRFAEIWWKVAPAHIELEVYESMTEFIPHDPFFERVYIYVGGACSQTIIYNI